MATLTDAQIAGLAVGAGFPSGEIAHAVAIALAESAGRTDAVGHNTNGTTDTGIWQINSVHNIPQATLLDPVQNAKAAHDIYVASGNRWTAWSTFNSGAYLPFMGRGNAAAGSPDNSTGGNSAPANNGGADTSGAAASLSKITMGSLWLRIGAGLLGVILLFMGLKRLMGVDQTIVRFAKGAGKMALDAAPEALAA